jgi:hypothetical protein
MKGCCAMPRRKCLFTEADLKRALHAAQTVGVPVQIEIRDGIMIVTTLDRTKPCEPAADINEWNEVLGNGQD